MKEGGGGGNACNAGGSGSGEEVSAMDVRLREIGRAVSMACSLVMGIEISPEDDFLAMGGDSLSALAVSKRLVELGGGTWPIDGIIHGRLAACELIRSPVLRDYSALLLDEGYSPALPASSDKARVKEEEEEEEEKEKEREEEAVGKEQEHQRSSDDSGASGGQRRGDDAAAPRVDQDLCRALRRACAAGDDEGVRHALELGADANDGMPTSSVDGRPVDVHTFEGVPPLHVAAVRGGRATVQILLDAGAKVNGKMYFYKRTPAHSAACAGNAEALAALIAGGVAVRAKDKARLTVMHEAARGGSVECLELLMVAGAGADVNSRDKWGRCPLHWAVINGHCEAALYLLDEGAESAPAHMPRRVQRRRTTLVQPDSLASLAREMHPLEHPIHGALEACGVGLGSGSGPKKQKMDGT